MGFHGAVGAAVIFGGLIQGATIEGSEIIGGDIQGATIEGGTITGATIQSSQTNPKTVMDTSGLRFYNGSGVLVGDIAPNISTLGELVITNGTAGTGIPSITLDRDTETLTLQADRVVILTGTDSAYVDGLPSKMQSITGTYTAGVGGIVTINHTLGVTGYDVVALGLQYALRVGARTAFSCQVVAYPFGSSVAVGAGTSVSLTGSVISYV